MTEHDADMVWWKLAVAWAGTLFGGITLSNLVLLATLVFTLMQIFKLARDLWRTRKG